MQTLEELIQKYDYDAALRLIREDTNQPASEKTALASRIEALKRQCIRLDPEHIPHIFFHALLVEPKRAFSSKKGDFNKWMITVREFHKILDELYSRGYVLVRLHDICYEVTDPDSGRKKMVYGDIMLPKGKKALVISQDDLCYYEYQNGCGLAQRIIPGKDGGLACEYIDANGAIHTGNYDLVPILDDFIKNHPDFSYRGARAVLGFTGYNGILGYRTDESYSPSSPYYDPEMEDSPNDSIDADRARAVEILKMLAGEGYELASHSWGHRDMNTVSLDGFQRDTDRWERNVQELIRKAVGEPSDIYIFPFGSDIGAVGGYARDILTAIFCAAL